MSLYKVLRITTLAGLIVQVTSSLGRLPQKTLSQGIYDLLTLWEERHIFEWSRPTLSDPKCGN
jgi:hypothetical protein